MLLVGALLASAGLQLPAVEPVIALALQYADVASFARAFGRRVGVPPGRWRVMYRR